MHTIEALDQRQDEVEAFVNRKAHPSFEQLRQQARGGNGTWESPFQMTSFAMGFIEIVPKDRPDLLRGRPLLLKRRHVDAVATCFPPPRRPHGWSRWDRRNFFPPGFTHTNRLALVDEPPPKRRRIRTRGTELQPLGSEENTGGTVGTMPPSTQCETAVSGHDGSSDGSDSDDKENAETNRDDLQQRAHRGDAEEAVGRDASARARASWRVQMEDDDSLSTGDESSGDSNCAPDGEDAGEARWGDDPQPSTKRQTSPGPSGRNVAEWPLPRDAGSPPALPHVHGSRSHDAAATGEQQRQR